MISEKETLDEFDQLIKTRNLDGLLPFLQEKSKDHLEALRKHILEAKSYWVDHKNLAEEPDYQGEKVPHLFGRRGDAAQIRIIVWTAIALLTKKEIQQWRDPFDFLKHLNNSPFYVQILEWAKPRWIQPMMLQQFRGRFPTVLPYRALRTLEQLELITHHPAIFALSIRQHWNYLGNLKAEDAIAMFDRFLADPLTWQRDIPQMFNYETWLSHVPHLCNYETWLLHLSMGYNQLEGNGPFPTWEYLYQKLLKENKMERRFFIENALLIQTKEWHRYSKAFYRELLAEIKVKAEEFIEFQAIIFSFFQANDLRTVAFGYDLCKKMHLLLGFDLHAFLEWISPLMLKVEAKKVIKSALPFLEKIAKSHSVYRVTIAEMVADVFSIPDLPVQERAAITLQKLNVLDSANLKAKINAYLPQVQGNVKQMLEPWLEVEDITKAEDPPVELYQYQPQKEKLLTQPIHFPNTWNDILFQIGKYINSDEPHEAEILLHAFICKRHLFPENYAEQLSAYHQQLGRTYFDIKYKNDVKGFLLYKLPDLKAKYHDEYYESGIPSVVELMGKLLAIVAEKLRHQSQLPLLCQPTHLPYWIEPKELARRIIDYQQAKEPIHALDLSIAIARMCRENIDEALPLLPQISGHLQILMKFCMGVETKILLHHERSIELWLPDLKGNHVEKLALWAVAARTHDSEGVFNEFLGTDLQKEAFVVKAFRPHFDFREAWEDGMNYNTRQIERLKTWEQLATDMPDALHGPANLLYALTFHASRDRWRDHLYNQANVFFWHSMMPQNPDPLAIRLIISSCQHADAGRSDMQGFLSIVDRPEFWFSETSTLTFACCFLQERKETRFLASEVLIHLIEKRKLDLALFAEKLAFLISGKYGVLMRCVEALVAIKDISPLYNNVLFTILDTMLGQLKIAEKLPLNFKKLLEHYLDIMVKTGQKPSAPTLAFLAQWQDNASLKNLIKQIAKP